MKSRKELPLPCDHTQKRITSENEKQKQIQADQGEGPRQMTWIHLI